MEMDFKEDIVSGTVEEDGSLARRAVKGGVWVFALKTAHRVLGLIRTIILARLLSPADFGLMGIAVLAIGTLDTFSQAGLEPALVQKKGDIRPYLDTVWTVKIIRSVVLFGLLYVSAPVIAGFFKTSQALQVIRVLAFLELFMGIKNIGTVYFQKELQFDRRFILEFSGLVANIGVSITLAFVLRNVWALVWGSLAGAFVTGIVSYMVHPYRPRIRFGSGKAKELFRFGKWLFGSSILYFLITQGDNAFVGKVIGITALGLYQMAYQLSNAPATEITHVVSSVTFPVYSKIQDDMARLRKVYSEVLQLNVFLAAPMATGIFILAPDFTRIFLGEKWLPMVPAMQLLALAGFLRALAGTTGAMFYALGRPKTETLWQGIRLATLAALIFPLSMQWGISGTALAVCASILVATVGFFHSVTRLTRIPFGILAKAIGYPVANTVVMAAFMAFMRRKMQIAGIPGFIFLVLAGLAVYLVASYVFERFSSYDVFNVLKTRLKGQAGHDR